MKRAFATNTVLALAIGAGVICSAQAAPPQEAPQAAFTWQMAERTRAVANTDFKPEIGSVSHTMIEGPVAGQPGLYGGVSSVPLDQINPPDGHEVTFDGCASSGTIKHYQWRVNARRLPGNATRCTATTRLHEAAA